MVAVSLKNSVHVYLDTKLVTVVGRARDAMVEAIEDGQNGVDGLDGATSVAVSPGGSHLYTIGLSDDAVVGFARNATTGQLTFQQVIKDDAGGATEGTLAGPSSVCYRSPVAGRYQPPAAPLGDHTDSGNDWQDKTALTGTARRDDGKGNSIFGLACASCHGGFGFGSIHTSIPAL